MRLVAAAAGCRVLANVLVAILVLWDEKLGHWSSRADGQDHLAVLRGRDVSLVVVLAGVQEGGSGGLDSPTGSVAGTTVVATVVATSLTAISTADLDGTQDLGGIAAAVTAGDDLHGALITLLTLGSSSSC